VWLLAVAPAPTGADDIGDGAEIRVGPRGEPRIETGVPDRAPLWDAIDPELQRRLERALANLGFSSAVRGKRLGVALVDITVLDRPRVAAVNGDEMMYAASLPKIAVLLSAFQKIEDGGLALDREIESQLILMIRNSSNTAASALMNRVGKQYIANVLRSPRYRLYDARHNGGLWVGKNYADAGLWRRDPLHNLSHGATAMQVARFYYMLETGDLVTPEYSHRMKEILSESTLNHKFVSGLKAQHPDASLCRKSGSWRRWHSDSAIVEHDGRRYIAVALCESSKGTEWLRKIIVALDDLVLEDPCPLKSRG
jgi:beta-lactamase class A